MAFPETETQALTYYQQKLEAARKTVYELRNAEAEVKEFEPIVAAMEKRLARLSPRDDEEQPAPLRIRAMTPPPRRRGKTSVMAALRQIMAEPGRWNVPQVIEALSENADFGENPPKRVTVTNRLNDLVNEGYLRSPGRGQYERVSPNGSAESVDAEGTEKAEPDSGVIPDEDEGLGSEPGGGPASGPPPGAQMQHGGGSAEVASEL